MKKKAEASAPGPGLIFLLYTCVHRRYPDRFLTGSDFVASFAAAKEYPGTKAKPNGCMKDKVRSKIALREPRSTFVCLFQANHARQVTDTGSMNMFFSDEAFRKIVLGENFFRLTNLQDQFSPPPLCEVRISGHEREKISILTEKTVYPIRTLR